MLALTCLPLCPSIYMEQLYSNWADLKEIWYLKIFGKYDEKISRFSKISEEQRMIYVKPDMFL